MSRRNGLTGAQEEFLDILAEEAAEIIQIVSKIKRFGYESRCTITGIPNRELLEMEIGDFEHLKERLIRQGELRKNAIEAAKKCKEEKIEKWLRAYPI